MPDDPRNEMPLDPAVFDQLWDVDDPAASERRMRDALARVPSDSVAAAELTTQIARAFGLQERYAEADTLLDTIGIAHPIVATRIQLERGRLRNSSGDPEASRRHFSHAFGHAVASGYAFLAVDAAHMLAIVEPDNAQHWVRQGLGIIETSNNPHVQRWRGALHNNLGWTLHEQGELEPALEQFRLAMDAYQANGTAAQVHQAKWAVARCLRALGRYSEALEIQQQLASDDPTDRSVQDEIGLLREALGPNERDQRPESADTGMQSRDAGSWSRDSFEEALAQAHRSLSEGGVPVGSALELGGMVVAGGHDRQVQDDDPIAHAVLSCLRAAGYRTSYRDAVIYTTLAPCAMCAGAIIQVGIPTVVVGESVSFSGELDLLRIRGVTVIELDDDRCKQLMTEFRQRYPSLWAEGIGSG